MNKTNSAIRLTAFTSLPSLADLPSQKTVRLVAVIPDVTEAAILAGEILSLARERTLDVVLLGICSSLSQETELRRKLVLLSAFIRDAGLHVDIRVEHGKDWIQNLRIMLRQDDLLACCVERNSGETRPPLSDALSSQLQVPLYVFSGADSSEATSNSSPAAIASWLGSLAIILGFLWLQIQIAGPGDDTAFTILVLLTVPLEIGLIWAWNSAFA